MLVSKDILVVGNLMGGEKVIVFVLENKYYILPEASFIVQVAYYI